MIIHTAAPKILLLNDKMLGQSILVFEIKLSFDKRPQIIDAILGYAVALFIDILTGNCLYRICDTGNIRESDPYGVFSAFESLNGHHNACPALRGSLDSALTNHYRFGYVREGGNVRGATLSKAKLYGANLTAYAIFNYALKHLTGTCKIFMTENVNRTRLCACAHVLTVIQSPGSLDHTFL